MTTDGNNPIVEIIDALVGEICRDYGIDRESFERGVVFGHALALIDLAHMGISYPMASSALDLPWVARLVAVLGCDVERDGRDVRFRFDGGQK